MTGLHRPAAVASSPGGPSSLLPRLARRLPLRAAALRVGGIVLLSLLGSLAFAASAKGAYYYCATALVNTGTSDGQANGSNCAYWLLPSFPLAATPDAPLPTGSVPGLDVLPVWRRTAGAGVTVALIDTGVDPNQADYAPNLLPGWNFYDGRRRHDGRSGARNAARLDHRRRRRQRRLHRNRPGGEGPAAQDHGRGRRRAVVDTAPAEAIYYAIAHGARVLNCSWGGLNVVRSPAWPAHSPPPRGRTSWS